MKEKLATNTIQCPECGKELPAEANFCNTCGAAIESQPDISTEETIRCVECGKELPAEANFCNTCGAAIKMPEDTLVQMVVTVEKEPVAAPQPQSRHSRIGGISKQLKPLDIVCVLLPLCSVALWRFSLNGIDLQRMNDLGLVSVLPPLTLLALLIMLVSFCLALRQSRTPIMLLHLALLVFMLYGVTTLIETEPHFDIVYRHNGYAEYIWRTGGLDPNLDAYFNWPGFFVWTAFLTQIAGQHDIYAYAVWAPVFLNLIYLGPMYVIFSSLTTDKRQIWLALWFFALANWIGQDYYSPQGTDFFMYLVIIAILLKWFKVSSPALAAIRKGRGKRWKLFSFVTSEISAWLKAPDIISTPAPRGRRVALLICLLLVFAFVVFSHPLTPFFVLASVFALVIFRRCGPFWLPVVMTVMTGVWVIFMAQTFISGHINWVIGDLGHFLNIFSSNVSQHVEGDAEHIFITRFRIVMTLFVWGLACLGGFWRWIHGHRDLTVVLLALSPFPLFAAQQYGGEMLLRVYLFALPAMVFFASALFFTTLAEKPARTPFWVTAMITGTCIVLLGGFLFTRYGNEHMDYMTEGEVAGVQYLYDIAKPKSVFFEGSDGTPWQFRDFEKYNMYSLTEQVPDAVSSRDVNAIISFIETKSRGHTNAYVIFTHSQKATATSVLGLSPDGLDRLQAALLATGRFKRLYMFPDVQILLFTG